MVGVAECESAVVCVRRAVMSDVLALEELRSKYSARWGTSGVAHSAWRWSAHGLVPRTPRRRAGVHRGGGGGPAGGVDCDGSGTGRGRPGAPDSFCTDPAVGDLEVTCSLARLAWIGHYGRVPSCFAVLCIDSVDPKPLALFWCDVLGWSIVDQDETDFSIGPADDVGPRIDFLAVPEAKAGKNRLHIDLRADGSTTAEELDRLLALGARRVDVGQGPDVTWVVLADPEGNEYCLLSRRAPVRGRGGIAPPT